METTLRLLQLLVSAQIYIFLIIKYKATIVYCHIKIFMSMKEVLFWVRYKILSMMLCMTNMLDCICEKLRLKSILLDLFKKQTKLYLTLGDYLAQFLQCFFWSACIINYAISCRSQKMFIILLKARLSIRTLLISLLFLVI
jgi:hypothetical protein